MSVKIIKILKRDEILIEEVVKEVYMKKLSDSATTDDSIRFKAFYGLSDSLTISQDLPVKVIKILKRDEMLIGDLLIARIGFRFLQNPLSVDDTISFKAIYRLSDGLLADDDITKIGFLKPHSFMIMDDVLKATVGKKVFDTSTIDDSIVMSARFGLSVGCRTDDDITMIGFLKPHSFMITKATIIAKIIYRRSI